MKKKMIFIGIGILIVVFTVSILTSKVNSYFNRNSKAVSIKNYLTTTDNKNYKNDALMKKQEVKNNNLYISVGAAYKSASSSVKIPINFENVNNSEISGCEVRVLYDTKALKIEKITPGQIVKNPKTNFFTKVNSEKGQIKIFYANDTNKKGNISKNGVFANIKFQINRNVQKCSSSIQIDESSVFYDKYIHKCNFLSTNGHVDIK